MAAIAAFLNNEDKGHLKAELQNLRRKGALRPSSDWDSTGPDPDRSCGRCRIELGRVINRGAYCRACRLKVCKGCREYSFKTTDWVCTVCHKHMEIQAASGEWMNEFVRRPSRRRDNRVYVPAADIIKRTIRRSWTISNPTPRWNAIRGSPELRPYNSLPRGQDINQYPSLALNQANAINQGQNSDRQSTIPRQHSPARRSQSEDVYSESIPRTNPSNKENIAAETPSPQPQRAARVNPLMKLGENKGKTNKTPSPKRRSQSVKIEGTPESKTDNKKEPYHSSPKERKSVEKRVSFDSKVGTKGTENDQSTSILRTQSLNETTRVKKTLATRSLPEEVTIDYGDDNACTGFEAAAKEDSSPVELCDIEPLSGTVFRKVTVRRRRQDMRKMPAIDTGWLRGPDTDLLDVLLPDGDEYKLVFISSDSSSKEDDVDDNDSSSTASSFLIDECDWDYFEPGSNSSRAVLNWSSPFGSPRVYRRSIVDSPLGSPLVYRRNRESDTGTDEDITRLDSGSPASSDSLFQSRPRDSDDSVDNVKNDKVMEEVALKCVHPETIKEIPQSLSCQSCGAPTQYIPIPVPVPIPVPIPTLWTQQDSLVLYSPQGLENRLRLLPRNMFPHLSHAALIWPSIINTADHSLLHSLFSQSESSSTSNEPASTMPTTATEHNNVPSTLAGNNDNKAEECLTPEHKLEPAATGCEETEVDTQQHHDNEDPKGVLASDNAFASSEDSGESSESGDEDNPRVKRIYNVNGDDSRESDDALPSSNVTSDEEEREEENDNRAPSSVREDDMSSSGSADTDSDDTGTVADQKSKRFTKVFVVNKTISSSSTDVSSKDSDSETDITDNDTDTELDATVILKNIRQLDFVENESFNEINTIEPGDLYGQDNEDKLSKLNTTISLDSENKIIEKCDNVSDKDNESDLIEDNLLNILNLQANPDDLKSNLQRTNLKDNDYILSSSPGLSDVSAESLNSSDVDLLRYEEKHVSENVNIDQNINNFTSSDGVHLSSEVYDENKPHNAKEEESVVGNEWNGGSSSTWSGDAVNSKVGGPINTRDDCEQTGAIVEYEPDPDVNSARYAARYTSLVMITQEPSPSPYNDQVNVITTDTTTLVNDNDVIVVKHTNWQEQAGHKEKIDDNQTNAGGESVTVITGGDTLSAFEEGLADDDSWVENLSHDEDEFQENSLSDDSSSGEEVTLTCSSALDREDELRGYHRAAIDFTLHTIIEESCEESEVDYSLPSKKTRPASVTDLEKYFFFKLGDGITVPINTNKEDTYSETSSICSEGLDSLTGQEETKQNDTSDPAELASSRLEKYFLSGFMGFTAERRDSDGSVGSDSEGKPSPEQRRKRLVRARGTGRSHSSSLDNLLANPDLATSDHQSEAQNSEDSSSSDTDTYDENNTLIDGQFDTVKRKKIKKAKNIGSSNEDVKCLETTLEIAQEKRSDDDDDDRKTPQPDQSSSSYLTSNKNQNSRDSGFVGSCDDLLKEQREVHDSTSQKLEDKLNVTKEAEVKQNLEVKSDERQPTILSTPPTTSLTRKDSFNNWSSDEETNLMMCKMRQFFKTMVANSQLNQSSKPTTPVPGPRTSPNPLASPRVKSRFKPPQLVYFENELTRLMKTVPGIRDDQVKEIVEYLSSEDTWSDSYDSSDYTSSDLEGNPSKSAIQQQISDSCQQIISKFDNNVEDEEGDEGDGGILDESHNLSKETAFVYQKLVASFEKMAAGNEKTENPHNSPPLIAKVMHHIGSRLVALMHEVSSGESHASNSPKIKHYHRRLQQKLSSASTTTTEDDDSTSESNAQENANTFDENPTPSIFLPRSKSHDLLLGESRNLHQSSSGVSDTGEEREVSDCERFSWRGSFESALLASDSRTKLSLFGSEGSASASALAIAAKRRSAGDLLFSHKSLSREQLDRVRSCGSIGGGNSEDKSWITQVTRSTKRRSSVPDASCGSGGSADGEEDDEELENRSTLPRSLQSSGPTTNSLPRLPTNSTPASMQKALSMHHFPQQNVKSARYRPPGFSRLIPSVPKRAVSAPGLQVSLQRRGRRSQHQNVPNGSSFL